MKTVRIRVLARAFFQVKAREDEASEPQNQTELDFHALLAFEYTLCLQVRAPLESK